MGPHAYKEFVQVFKRHSGEVSSNEIGLSILLGLSADNSPLDPRLTDPSEAWENDQAHHRAERRPLWAFAVGVSLVVLVAATWQGATPAVCAALSGLLLYSLLPMTSYDYSWLVLLIALAASRPSVLPRLIVFALIDADQPRCSAWPELSSSTSSGASGYMRAPGLARAVGAT